MVSDSKKQKQPLALINDNIRLVWRPLCAANHKRPSLPHVVLESPDARGRLRECGDSRCEGTGIGCVWHDIHLYDNSLPPAGVHQTGRAQTTRLFIYSKQWNDVCWYEGHARTGYPSAHQAGHCPRCCPHAPGLLEYPRRDPVQHHSWR